jgi:hypothetical protein
MLKPLLPLLALVPTTAIAQDWNIRPWDEELPRAAIVDRISGNTLEFADGGKSEYLEDGRYAYIYSNGNRVEGRYEIAGDGSVCVAFDNGWARCDYYVAQGDRLVLINEQGGRYPINQLP